MLLLLLFLDFHSNSMKILLVLFSFIYFIILPAVEVSAACAIDTNSAITIEAGQFLSECASTTRGINPGNYGGATATQEDTKKKIIDIANTAISFWALLAVGAIVWAGLQYTKSFWDDEKLKKAKTTGIFAVIGLIMLLVSFGIVDIFINFIYTITGN